jgi:hypothetical protein
MRRVGGGASGVDERGTGQKRGMGSGQRLLWRPGGAVERKGRAGPGVGAAWREGSGEERGGPKRDRG